MSNIYIQEPPALGKRTEAQLKKCWDNLKTRRKAQLTFDRQRERMTAIENPFLTGKEVVLEQPVLNQSDVELLVVDSDYVPQRMDDDSTEELEDTQAPELSVEQNEDSVEDNLRERTIRDEFEIRKLNYQRAQEREEELHRLKMQEMKFRLMAAEEAYKKACLERQTAEEMLKKAKGIE